MGQLNRQQVGKLLPEKPTNEEQTKTLLKEEIKADWLYWWPISQGWVRLTRDEWDKSSPWFAAKLLYVLDEVKTKEQEEMEAVKNVSGTW